MIYPNPPSLPCVFAYLRLWPSAILSIDTRMLLRSTSPLLRLGFGRPAISLRKCIPEAA